MSKDYTHDAQTQTRRHGVSNDPALRSFVQDFWRSMKPQPQRLQMQEPILATHSDQNDHYRYHRRDTLISPISGITDDESSSVLLSEYELGSVDTDALLSVVLDRSLLDFGFDYTCFASLDNKLLLSPLDAFADVCWSDATSHTHTHTHGHAHSDPWTGTGTQLSRSMSQPSISATSPTAVRRDGSEGHRPQSHPVQARPRQLPVPPAPTLAPAPVPVPVRPAPVLLYREKSVPSSRVPRSVSIDDYERDDWFDDEDEDEDEDELEMAAGASTAATVDTSAFSDDEDDTRSVTPTPSLCYSDDSIPLRDRDDAFGDVDVQPAMGISHSIDPSSQCETSSPTTPGPLPGTSISPIPSSSSSPRALPQLPQSSSSSSSPQISNTQPRTQSSSDLPSVAPPASQAGPPAANNTTTQKRPSPKRVPVPVYTPSPSEIVVPAPRVTAVEAHYQARGRQPLAYVPVPAGAVRYGYGYGYDYASGQMPLGGSRTPPVPSPPLIGQSTSVNGSRGARKHSHSHGRSPFRGIGSSTGRVQTQERPIAAW